MKERRVSRFSKMIDRELSTPAIPLIDADDLLQTFSSKLAIAMELKSFGSRDLCALLVPTSEMNVYHWIAGRHLPRASELVRLAAALNVSIDWLLGADKE